MSIAFSRSIRLMRQDSFRMGLVGLTFLLIFLGAWLAWFFLARIPLYESSRAYQIRRDGILLVTFSPQALGRILPGQQATLSFPETAGQPGQVFTAEVMDLPKGQGAVEVYVFSSADTLPLSLLQTAAGEVKVQVGSVSPAALALRSAGRLMGKP